MEKVSVIVAVYNVENYLTRCVKSILQQTYTNIEVILVDDGSTDTSGILCDEIAANDYRVTVIHKKNGGLSSARNKALNIIKGEYLTFVDSDDMIHSHMIEWMIEEIKTSSADFVATGLLSVGDKMPVEENLKVKFDVLDKEDFINHLFPNNFGRISVTACGKLYKKELFSEIRYPEGEIYEDLRVYLPLLLKCKKISVSMKPLYYWYNNTQSITRSNYLRYDRFGEFLVRENYIEFFYKRNLQDQVWYAANEYLTFFMRNYFAVMIKYKSLKVKLNPHINSFKRHLKLICQNPYSCRMRKLCAILMVKHPYISYWIAKKTIPDCLIEEMR